MLLRTRRPILVALATAQVLTGCTSWHVVSVSPRALVDSAHAKSIRVQEKGGSTYVLDAPLVVGDTLVGTVWHKVEFGSWERSPNRISLAAVDQVAVRKFGLLKTILLAVVGVPVALLVIVSSIFGVAVLW